MGVICKAKRKIRNHIELMPIYQKKDIYQAMYDSDKLNLAKSLIKAHFKASGRKILGESFFIDFENEEFIYDQGIVDFLIKFDVISFDIFDTLILRSVGQPSNIFKIVGNKLNIADFTNIRINAEKMARQKREKKGQSNEVNLDEIYEFIDFGSKEKDIIKKYELDTEIESSRANAFIQNIYYEMLKHNKKVILISDMYLSRKEIEKILKKCNYQNADEIFISSEYRESKSNGKLFNIAERKIGKDKKIIHIGDNFYSDVLSCSKCSNVRPLLYCLR